MKITLIINGVCLLFLLVACNSPNTEISESTTDKMVDSTAETVVDLVDKIEYSSDSTLKLEYQIDQNTGNKHGVYKEYDLISNALLIERVYQQNRIEGVEKIYFTNGQIDGELMYVNGIHNGAFKYYYEDGTLKQEGSYKEGKIEGILSSYYPNGGLKEEVMHLEGVTQGAFKEYNENKTLKAEGEYTSRGDQENLEHGLLKLYDGEGKLTNKMVCKEGKCCTIWTVEDGDVKPSNKLCEAIIGSYEG